MENYSAWCGIFLLIILFESIILIGKTNLFQTNKIKIKIKNFFTKSQIAHYSIVFSYVTLLLYGLLVFLSGISGKKITGIEIETTGLGLALFALGISGVGILSTDNANSEILERLSRIEIKIDKLDK